MIKNIAIATVATLIFIGCGGGGDSTSGGGTLGSQTITKAYNLWDYMVPNSSKTNRFTLSSINGKSNYNTTYTVSKNRVEEVADYASDEKTIYEKKANKIVVNFTKAGQPNGTYNLLLSADIGDIVTERKSTCRLTKHLEIFELEGKSFQDVIEITCGNIPGYYQKGIGEIAQIENSSDKKIRVLSN